MNPDDTLTTLLNDLVDAATDLECALMTSNGVWIGDAEERVSDARTAIEDYVKALTGN